ncbi:transposase, partial [Stenotrophomonas maltophilia]
MASKQYTDEFKAEAVKQVTERGFAVAEVAKRLGVSSHSLYQWLRKARSEALAGTPEGSMLPTPKDSAEVRRLKAEVKRLTEERDILKKGSSPNSGEGRPDLQEEVRVVSVSV